MADALAIITQEHRNLGAVLSCLKSLIDDVEARGLKPDFKVFHAILNYLEFFLNTVHHPKESEHLFPALRRCCPATKTILDQLEHQHWQEESLMHGLRYALAAYESQGAKAATAFFNAARRYTDFERQHAALEEREILPLAREHLSADDWAPINDAFAANEDPVFGGTPKEEYRELLKTIVNLAPAPHGVADPWQPAS